MKVNKTQAIYKYLPGAWTTGKYPENNKSAHYYSIRIINWNTKEVKNVYKIKIKNEIIRNINAFENRNGDVSEFINLKNSNGDDTYELLEPAMNIDFPDILSVIDSTVFYCTECHSVQMINSNNFINEIRCKNCGKDMKQLQFVYACECGQAYGITVKNKYKQYYYEPDLGKKGGDTYQFYYKNNQNKIPEQMIRTCECGNVLRPRNAEDGAIFHPFEIKTVNLIDRKMGEFLKFGDLADKVLIANWVDLIDEATLQKVLKNPEESLKDNSNDDLEIKNLADTLKLPYETVKTIYYTSNPNKIMDNIQEKLLKVNSILENDNSENIDSIATELLEYYTLKKNDNVITLDEVKNKSKKVDSILDEREIDQINNKAKISNAIVSHNIEIINAAYGYTRIVTDPENVNEHYKKLGKKLKLKAFLGNGKYNVYTSLLNTEGILIEFNRKMIFEWLLKNEITDDDIDFNDDKELKRWFINNVDLSEISAFSEIKHVTKKQIITKCVYGLIHTISHLLIRSAGIYSGLNKDSIAELLFPNIPSIYLYSTTIQGITMGSLSGMYEENYKAFISTAMQDYEMCMFDPICMEKQNGSCVACTILNETSCAHFNKDLSRAYLYGGEIKFDNNVVINIKKGFWK
ncbi:MAG TPA: hypothetical protein IAD08_00730 [Candidatus Scatovivens faecipullorum]|nr:hypothetical protein [Candidatus Scatovivens faecipullorum]